jgi:hypothetical protein
VTGVRRRLSDAEKLFEQPPAAPEQLTDEEQAAFLLFRRELGETSVARLARGALLPVAVVEEMLCRALSTLLARGCPAEFLCDTFSLSQAQLARAAKAPPFGPEFEPRSLWWPPDTAKGASGSVPAAIDGTRPDEDELIAELSELLRDP